MASTQVEELLRNGLLKISYSYLPSSQGGGLKYAPEGWIVDTSDEKNAATRFFRGKQSAVRLQLTLGPVVRTHRSEWVPGRTRFKSGNDYVDIRADKNTLIVEPGETITAITNEYVKFGGTVAALVTPRVTTTDSGLLLATAYIDPFYEGLLRVTLHNATQQRQAIRLTEPIAQCLFFHVDGEIAPAFQAELSAKSVFFGNTWQKILDEDSDPLPRRKRPVAPRPFAQRAAIAWQWVRRNMVRSVLTIASLSALAALLLAVGNLNGQIQRLADLEKEVATLRQSSAPLASSSGAYPFRLDASQQSVQVEIPTDIRYSTISTTWVNYHGRDDLGVSWSVAPAPGNEGTLIIVTINRTSSTGQEIDGVLDWMVITR